MVGTGQDGVDAGPHFLRVISIDLRLVTNSDVGHPFVLLLLLLSSTLFRLADQRGGKEAFLGWTFFAPGSLYYFDAVCKSWCKSGKENVPISKIGLQAIKDLRDWCYFYLGRNGSRVAEMGNGGLIVFKWVEQSLKKQRTINGDVLQWCLSILWPQKQPHSSTNFTCQTANNSGQL